MLSVMARAVHPTFGQMENVSIPEKHKLNFYFMSAKPEDIKVTLKDLVVVRERLASVKNKVLVLSGKGGVGKSTVSAMLGRALALDDSKEGTAQTEKRTCVRWWCLTETTPPLYSPTAATCSLRLIQWNAKQ
uniref:Uncharacterized protein n=1 Tax=Scylla olivacea TaxID=85551 RepID=A0A0P4WDH0_SCYOL